VPSHHLFADGGELSGDHADILCACGTATPFYFALSDGDGGFVIDCKSCFARLIAYRARR
jgi:hypothetical protein